MRLLVGLLLTLALLVCGAFWQLLIRPIPGDPAMAIAPLEEPANIHYDERRRPFVRAATWADAYAAQGWLHARERLWQMELIRRAGQGRLAELFGAGLIETDVELWRVGVPDLAVALESHTSPEVHALVEAYVAGVNAGLESLGALPFEMQLLGFEPEPWRARDVYGIGAIMAFQSGNNFRNELLRLKLAAALPEDLKADFGIPAGSAVAAAQLSWASDARAQPGLAVPTFGSNGWAIAGQRSASGDALLAFDSHDGFSLPNLTYDVHLFVSDEQIRGQSVPGLPGVINGYNEAMAWGFTNIGDSQDLFLDAPVIERRAHTIAVSGAEDHTFDIVTTSVGPLIQHDPPIALAWSVQESTLGLDGLFLLNRATSHAEFDAALNAFRGPSASATYADREGTIAQRVTGVLPVRKSGDGLTPVSADQAWVGMLPLTQLPNLTNPEAAFVAAANARANLGDPLVSADNAPGYRQGRLTAVLSQAENWTATDMAALQVDWHNAQAERLLPEMIAAVDLSQLIEGTRAEERLAKLTEWAENPLAKPELAEPLWFERWYLGICKRLFEPVLGEPLYADLTRASYVLNHAADAIIQDATSPWWQGNRSDLITAAFTDTLNEHRAWAEAHGTLHRHEMHGTHPLLDALLSRGPLASGGGNATLGRARYRYHQPFDATGGATVRMVVQLSDTPRTWSIVPGGQSGHPWSPHYDDQLDAWRAGQLDDIAPTPESLGPATTRLTSAF